MVLHFGRRICVYYFGKSQIIQEVKESLVVLGQSTEKVNRKKKGKKEKRKQFMNDTLYLDHFTKGIYEVDADI